MDGNNGMLLFIALAFVALIAFQIFGARRRKAQAAERATAILPGVEVMTTTGIYGTVVSIDAEENVTLIEIAPNVIIKVHSRAIAHAVPVPSDDDTSEEPESSGPELNTSNAVPMAESEPEFGEREKKSPSKKPTTDDK